VPGFFFTWKRKLLFASRSKLLLTEALACLTYQLILVGVGMMARVCVTPKNSRRSRLFSFLASVSDWRAIFFGSTNRG
jgi:hypothetical protein